MATDDTPDFTRKNAPSNPSSEPSNTDELEQRIDDVLYQYRFNIAEAGEAASKGHYNKDSLYGKVKHEQLVANNAIAALLRSEQKAMLGRIFSGVYGIEGTANILAAIKKNLDDELGKL